MAKLTVTVITRDEAAHVEAALASVAWADEVVVVDSGSTDGTAELARRHGARVEVRGWPGYSAQKNFGSTTSLTAIESFGASLTGQLSIPVYQGGTEYATIRQAKETLQQRRIDLDTAREQAQQTLVQTWGQL